MYKQEEEIISLSVNSKYFSLDNLSTCGSVTEVRCVADIIWVCINKYKVGCLIEKVKISIETFI